MRIVFACATLTVLLLSWSALAGPLTSDEAVMLVRNEVSDRVLRVTPALSSDGRDTYRIRLIDEDGRMYTLEVDAESGDMREIATGPMVLPRGAPPAEDTSAPEPASEEQNPCAS